MTETMRYLSMLLPAAALLLPISLPAADLPLTLPPAEQQILLKDEPAKDAKPLFDTLNSLPARKVITLEELNQKRFSRLQDVAGFVGSQRDSMVEFDGYVKWMGGTLAGYSRYVEAGSFAANFARLLPIPYAGQAGQLSKFVSHFALALSGTSVAVKQYLASSQQFLTRVQGIGSGYSGKENEMAALTFLADQQLAKDMLDLQNRLATTSDLSASALSFLISMQQYLGGTDEYWQKTKALVGKKESDRNEKGALAGSIDGLKQRAEEFNKRLKVYDDNVGKTLPLIATLVAYDELRQDIEAK
ncbi:MAG: hypothetical protein H6Q56_1686 [Deltaproteobacteria bacterium]|nr:hypothetical protein [Deltaproteobacteria bacterium]